MFILVHLPEEDCHNLSHVLAKLSVPGSVAHLIVFGGYVELKNQRARVEYWCRASGTCGEGLSDLSGGNARKKRTAPGVSDTGRLSREASQSKVLILANTASSHLFSSTISLCPWNLISARRTLFPVRSCGTGAICGCFDCVPTASSLVNPALSIWKED